MTTTTNDGLTVTQREYFERLFMERDRQATEQVKALAVSVEDKRQALALAVEKQEKAYDIRFANVNEWRQTFGDLVSKGATREYVDARLNEIIRRQEEIERWQARINGQFAVWGVALTLFATAITILSRFVNFGGG